ncbi:MAG: hypothetical protein F6K42_31295 [Leptolyngbya sp. SIO1D8]|nr:hypothetical protein [Leptolyngbya sp. SIO1D8]
MSTSIELANQVKARIEAEILQNSFVSGIDVGLLPDRSTDSQAVAIRVYVTDPERAAVLPKEVDGVPIIIIPRRFLLH